MMVKFFSKTNHGKHLEYEGDTLYLAYRGREGWTRSKYPVAEGVSLDEARGLALKRGWFHEG